MIKAEIILLGLLGISLLSIGYYRQQCHYYRKTREIYHQNCQILQKHLHRSYQNHEKLQRQNQELTELSECEMSFNWLYDIRTSPVIKRLQKN